MLLYKVYTKKVYVYHMYTCKKEERDCFFFICFFSHGVRSASHSSSASFTTPTPTAPSFLAPT